METLQPKLRFSEFNSNWEIKQLKQITSLITKGTTPQNFSENGINFIKIECLNGHNIDTSKCLFIDEKTHTKDLKRSMLEENDLLFAIAGATIGKCTIVTKEALPANTNQALAIIRLKENQNKDYIFQILTSEGMSKYIKDNISVGAQPNLNLEQINSFSFSYPSLEEQTKIADFLSAVDEKINLLKEKKTLLEDYKKGIMQKIFNQEIRFKDDNGYDYKDWETINLIDILKENKTRNKHNEIKEVFSVAKSKGVINQIEHLGRSYASDNISNYKVVFENDIIYTKSPTTDFPYGIIKQNKLNRKGVVSVLYGIFTPLNKYVGNLLDNYFSDWKNTYNYLDPIIQKGAKNTINIGNETFLNGETLMFPMDINEQIKISNFFVAMDNKIEIVSNQIKDNQEYKKGLLQQMFI